jgi:hypothetical protein
MWAAIQQYAATSVKAKTPSQKKQDESETPNATQDKEERLREREVGKRRDQYSEQQSANDYD